MQKIRCAWFRILAILKPLARVGNPAELPEFREYSLRKYPNLDEDLITMIEDLIERSADKDCPIGLAKIHCDNCYFWRDGKCDHDAIMREEDSKSS